MKTFGSSVRPTIEPKLSEYCTKQTKLTQVQADFGPNLEDALKQIHDFLGESNIFESEFVFLTVGDNDLKLLGTEAKAKNVALPNYLQRWINIKKVFPVHLFNGTTAAPDFTTPGTINKAKPTVIGIAQMLEICGLEPKDTNE